MADIKKTPSIEELLAKIEALEAKSSKLEEQLEEIETAEYGAPVQETAETCSEEEFKARQEYMSKKVEIRLIKDKDRYKDDVIVNVNGKAWQIKRGVYVSVPRYIAEVIESSEKQDERTADLIDELVTNYENESK